MEEKMYTIITLNGRAYQFYADELKECGDTWMFYYDDDLVAEFKKDALAGYFITTYFEEEE